MTTEATGSASCALSARAGKRLGAKLEAPGRPPQHVVNELARLPSQGVAQLLARDAPGVHEKVAEKAARRARLLAGQRVLGGRARRGRVVAQEPVDVLGRDQAVLDEVATQAKLAACASRLHEIDEPVAHRDGRLGLAVGHEEHARLRFDLKELQHRPDGNGGHVARERGARRPRGRRQLERLGHLEVLGYARRHGRAARAPPLRAPDGVLDDGDERLRVEGLRDGVDRARLLHEVLADAVRLGAHQDDRHGAEALVLTQGAAQLIPVHARHDEVHEHQIDGRSPVGSVLLPVGRALKCLERRLAVGRVDGFEAMPLEHRAHDLADGRAVVHDEDSSGHGRLTR